MASGSCFTALAYRQSHVHQQYGQLKKHVTAMVVAQCEECLVKDSMETTMLDAVTQSAQSGGARILSGVDVKVDSAWFARRAQHCFAKPTV